VKSRFLSPLFFTFRSRCTEYDSLSTFAPPSYIACPSSTCLAAEADCKQLFLGFFSTDTARGAPSTCPPYLLMPVAYSTPAKCSHFTTLNYCSGLQHPRQKVPTSTVAHRGCSGTEHGTPAKCSNFPISGEDSGSRKMQRHRVEYYGCSRLKKGSATISANADNRTAPLWRTYHKVCMMQSTPLECNSHTAGTKIQAHGQN
jgi:hypothetical protein